MFKTSPKNIKISLLYSQKDKSYSEGLRKHLKALISKHRNTEIHLIEDLPFGDARVQLRSVLAKSDIVLLLLSSDFLNESLLDGETRILLETQKKGHPNERFIMPIILRSFGWEIAYGDHEIQKITLFKDPISLQNDKDPIYKKIVATLDKYVEELNFSSIKMALPTWAGYLSAISYNKGLSRNKNTWLYKKYKKTIRIDLNDNHEELLEAWKAGEADVVGLTMDTLPHVLEHYSELEPQIIFQASWSSGADAIVVRDGINDISELKGKRIVCPQNTPSHYFLRQVMKKAGLSKYDVYLISADISTPDEAVACFKAHEEFEAVVLWSPYMESCLHDVPNTKILTDTRDFPNLITDVLIASKSFIHLHQEELQEIIRGWLAESRRLKASINKQDEAVAVFVEGILKPLPSIIPNNIRQSLKELLMEYFTSALCKIHLCNYDNNAMFFGLDGEQFPLGQKLLEALDNKDSCVCWEDIVEESIIRSVKRTVV